MSLDLETPTAALYARLTAISGIKYSSRILHNVDDVPPGAMPALFLTSGSITVFDPPSGSPGMTPSFYRVINVVVIYVQQIDPEIPASVRLNELIAGVCNAMLRQQASEGFGAAFAPFVPNPPGARYTTLGGLVQFARVCDTTEIEEGNIGDVSVAAIPLEMVLTQ